MAFQLILTELLANKAYKIIMIIPAYYYSLLIYSFDENILIVRLTIFEVVVGL